MKKDREKTTMSVPRILATHRARVTIFVGEDVVFIICSSWIEQKLYLYNGLRYWRWGGRGFCLGAGKTRSQKTA
jgi:hypothetical protein